MKPGPHVKRQMFSLKTAPNLGTFGHVCNPREIELKLQLVSTKPSEMMQRAKRVNPTDFEKLGVGAAKVLGQILDDIKRFILTKGNRFMS